MKKLQWCQWWKF